MELSTVRRGASKKSCCLLWQRIFFTFHGVPGCPGSFSPMNPISHTRFIGFASSIPSAVRRETVRGAPGERSRTRQIRLFSRISTFSFWEIWISSYAARTLKDEASAVVRDAEPFLCVIKFSSIHDNLNKGQIRGSFIFAPI